MNTPMIDDQILTQYLLGMLSERDKEDIEDRIFTNDAYYNQLLLLEDELIDEYVCERLSRKERKYFEKNFLSSTERYEKIRFAKALQANLSRFLIKNDENLYELSNTELIHRITNSPNNRLAWKEFFRRFDDHIRAVVVRLSQKLNSKDILNDLVQDVYAMLVAHDMRVLKQFKGIRESSIYVFLTLVTRSVCLMYRAKMVAMKGNRRASQKNELDEGFRLIDTLADPYASSPDERLLLESVEQEIESVLEEVLPQKNIERNKAIFKMFVFEEMSVTNIAQRFNLSSRTVNNIITTIRKKIREKSSKKP